MCPITSRSESVMIDKQLHRNCFLYETHLKAQEIQRRRICGSGAKKMLEWKAEKSEKWMDYKQCWINNRIIARINVE